MKYVFFDIECANYVNDMFTICTFGYTIVDSNFNVIKKEDILINPHSKFNKIVLNKIIHYKEEDFLDKPSFAEIYPFIKELLTNKDHMCFGFDVGNDLRFLNGEYKRYDLEPINVKAYDIQHIHKLIKQLKTPESLSKAAMSMDIDFDSIELHNSKDDAYLTMLVAKELEKISDTPLHQLINLSNHIAIDSNNIVNPNKARSNELKLLISKYPERNKAFSFCLSEELEAKDKEKLRPGQLICFVECTNVTVKDVTIQNTPGSLLPETGGIGTTVFYVLGGSLMLGAAVIVLLKKREINR